MAGSVISINLLGEFSILKDGKPILTSLSNTRKTKLFMAYLLVNRDRYVPHKELFELLWSGEEYSNPGTALRTLLYRLRAMFEKEGRNHLSNAVISKKGTYQWNPNLKVRIDIIDFEKFALNGLNKDNSTEIRTDNLKKAIKIYKGNLLPDFNSEPWVLSKAAYYREIYENVVEGYIEILKENNDIKGIRDVSVKALELLGFSEIISLEKDMAIATLNEDEDCLNITKEHYLRVHNLSAILHDNAVKMQEDIESDVFEQKAFICNYETFKAIYKLQRRMLMRTKQTLFLGLINVHCNEDYEKKFQKIMDNVLKLCSHQLRCADTICKKDSNNFAILFPADSYDDAIGVLERIKNIVIKEYDNKLIVVYQLRTLKNTKE